MAWSVAGAIFLIAALLPDSGVGRLCAGTAVATAIVLLATARTWGNQRALTESILLLGALLAAGMFISRTPTALQIAMSPVLMILVTLATLAWCEWRFAPDFGQTGVAWAFVGAAKSAIWAGMGLGLAMIVRSAFDISPGIASVITYVCGAGAGHRCGGLLAPARYATEAPPELARESDERPAPEGNSSADWWKQL